MADKTKKKPVKRHPEKSTTTSQKILDLPPPKNSDDCAYRIKQMNLDIAEDHRTIAQLFHIWMVWFIGPPNRGLTESDWLEEVWQYLSESRWSKGRIHGYLNIFDDKRIWDLPTSAVLLTDPEAFIWLGNTNVKHSKDTVTAALKWLKTRWRKNVWVSKEALCREFRRSRAMQPKMYFENESSIVRVVVYILDVAASDDKIKSETQYVVHNGCKRSTVGKTQSGNYVEVLPRFQ